jgi:hypothetical protein
VARVQIGRDVGTYRAREATAAEIGRHWPQLVQRWPAYQTFFARTEQRTLFVLERASDGGTAEDRPAHDRGTDGERHDLAIP